MQHQPDKIYFYSLSHLTQTLREPSLPSSPITVAVPPPPSVLTQSLATTTTTSARTPPTNGTTCDIPSPVTITKIPTSNVDSVHTCPRCDRAFTSHMGPVGHLRIRRTETGEPVPGARHSLRLPPVHSPDAWAY
ncbi:hypothetical protein SprV_0200985200 [Sparganum proliferum]